MSDEITTALTNPDDVQADAPVVLPPVVEPPSVGRSILVLMGYDADGQMITARQPVSPLAEVANKHGHPLREIRMAHGVTYVHTAELPDGTWVYAAEDAGAR